MLDFVLIHRWYLQNFEDNFSSGYSIIRRIKWHCDMKVCVYFPSTNQWQNSPHKHILSQWFVIGSKKLY